MLGDELTKGDVDEEPSINFAPMVVPAESADNYGSVEVASGEDAGEATYTLAMIDIDAQPKELATVRHWLVSPSEIF